MNMWLFCNTQTWKKTLFYHTFYGKCYKAFYLFTLHKKTVHTLLCWLVCCVLLENLCRSGLLQWREYYPEFLAHPNFDNSCYRLQKLSFSHATILD